MHIYDTLTATPGKSGSQSVCFHPSLGIVVVGPLITCRHRRIAYDFVAMSPNVGNIPNDALRGLVRKRVGEGSGQRGNKIGCYIECVGAILASVGVNVGW